MFCARTKCSLGLSHWGGALRWTLTKKTKQTPNGDGAAGGRDREPGGPVPAGWRAVPRARCACVRLAPILRRACAAPSPAPAAYARPPVPVQPRQQRAHRPRVAGGGAQAPAASPAPPSMRRHPLRRARPAAGLICCVVWRWCGGAGGAGGAEQRTVVRTAAGVAFGGIAGTLLMRKRPAPPPHLPPHTHTCSHNRGAFLARLRAAPAARRSLTSHAQLLAAGDGPPC